MTAHPGINTIARRGMHAWLTAAVALSTAACSGTDPVDSTGTGGVPPGSGGAVGGTTDAGGGSATGGASTGGASPGGTTGTGGSSSQTAGCGKTTWPTSNDASGSDPYTLSIDGTTREYYVSVPDAYDSNQPTRVVFAWHWRGGTASDITGTGGFGFGGGYYGLKTSIPDAIYIAAEGLSDNGQTGWANTNGRDIAFLRAMLDWLDTNYCIDRARIFSVGFSYGGIMSDTIACQLGRTFRAIAPIAGSMFGGAGNCVDEPVAAHMTHGVADTTLDISGGITGRDYLIAANHCTMTSQPIEPSPCVEYAGCDDGYPVVWCEHTGGHTVPSFASEAIATFFERF